MPLNSSHIGSTPRGASGFRRPSTTFHAIAAADDDAMRAGDSAARYRRTISYFGQMISRALSAPPFHTITGTHYMTCGHELLLYFSLLARLVVQAASPARAFQKLAAAASRRWTYEVMP